MTNQMQAQGEAPHRFHMKISWQGNIGGSGEAHAPDRTFACPINAAPALGGAGTGANPEELFLASVGSCFVATWALFLDKLKVPHASLSLEVLGELGQDPVGGYRMQSLRILCRIPGTLLAERQHDIQQSLKLAEKYCIISKIARAAMPVTVDIEAETSPHLSAPTISM